MKRVFVAQATILAVIVVGQSPVTAQDDLPRPKISSRVELLSSLRSAGTPDKPYADVHYMFIALGGAGLVPALTEILSDPSAGPLRWQAIHVLHYLRPRAAAPLLMRLAEDRERTSLGYDASAALVSFTYPEVCDYWRRAARSSRGSTTWRHAVRGMLYCAIVDDDRALAESLELVRGIHRFTAHSDLKSITERADSVFSKRLRGVSIDDLGLEWPGVQPVQQGRFFPDAAQKKKILSLICDDSPCPGVVLSVPEVVKRIRLNVRSRFE